MKKHIPALTTTFQHLKKLGKYKPYINWPSVKKTLQIYQWNTRIKNAYTCKDKNTLEVYHAPVNCAPFPTWIWWVWWLPVRISISPSLWSIRSWRTTRKDQVIQQIENQTQGHTTKKKARWSNTHWGAGPGGPGL